jgi:hypothetical protein
MTLPAPSGPRPAPAPREPVDAAHRAPPGGPEKDHRSRRVAGVAQMARVVRVIRDADEDAVLRLSRTHRLLAPLAVAVGAFVMLFEGLKLLVSNWRLTLVQVLPAMWIWLAMIDLKAHALHGKSFTIVSGPLLVAAMLLITAITAASFFLNAVFAFAIAAPGPPDIGTATTLAWKHRRVVLSWGTAIGVLLAFATVVVDRWGTRWFSQTLRDQPQRPPKVSSRHFGDTRRGAHLVGGTASLATFTRPPG